MKLRERLNLDWYEKRINQNKYIKKFLVDKILEHEPEIGYSKRELMFLNYEDLFELAIACVNKKISVVLGEGQDFDNGFDAKFSIVRTNSRGRRYSSSVRCKTKDTLYNCVYERIHNKFYFFVLPANGMAEIDIPFTLDGHPKKSNDWWNFAEDSFEEMCLKTSPSKKKLDTFDNLFTFHA